MKVSSTTLFATVATVVSAVVIVVGFSAIGSPAERRLQRLDQRRVSDLRSMSNYIDSYWRNQKILPEDIEALRKRNPGLRMSDPVTGDLYEYRRKGDAAYELCATFEAVLDRKNDRDVDTFWKHGKGRHCFQMEAQG